VSNNAADPSKVSLSWIASGSPAGYTVRYGLSQDALSNKLETTSTNAQI
jgi:hypothetical protein